MQERLRLLLIEDGKLDQIVFRRLIEKQGLNYDCTLAETISETREALANAKFDIIVADYYLPDGTAFDVLPEIKDTPVIIVTGAEDHEIALKAIKAGAIDFLIKDRDRNYLKALPASIENAINAHKIRIRSRLLANALENTHDAVYLTDESGVITYVNLAFQSTFGFSGVETVGQHHSMLWPEGSDSKGAKGKYSDCFVGDFQGELDYRVRDGSSIPVIVSWAAIGKDEEYVSEYVSVVRDISDLKQEQERRLELENQLRQSQKLQAVGQLAGGIAHDFNNILASIIGFSQLCMEDVPEGEIVYSNLCEVLTAAKRAKHLVQQILTFSRYGDVTREPVNLCEIAQETHSMLRATTPANVTLNFEKNLKDEESVVYGDATQVHQLIMNLCTNAIHAVADKSAGLIQLRICHRQVEENDDLRSLGLDLGRFVEICVEDNGKGMSPEVQERIFEPFYTTKDVGQGTGLGLAAVHGIVDDHGGRVFVDSEEGTGTKFSIYIPFYDVAEETNSEGPKSIAGGNEHIMLVDDEEAIIKMTTQMLERLGYKVTSTTNSQQALSLFETTPGEFDLIISDQTMPGLCGSELISAMLEIRPEQLVILCSGYSETMNPERAIDLGCKDYLLKPVLLDELALKIRGVLDS